MMIIEKTINLYHTLRKNNFVRFCIVGSCGVITNLIIFYITRNYIGANINLAAILAFCVAVTQNYYFNHFWSFKNLTGKPNLPDYAKYLLINILGLGANLLILNAIIHFYPNIFEVIAQGLSIFSALIVNYIGSYVFVFAKNSPFSVKIKGLLVNERVKLAMKEIRKKFKIIILILLISLFIIFIGQMISVIGGRQIIEPITITAQDLNGNTPSSFKRFIQLARADNYTLITENRSDKNNPWKVSGVFAKKILIGISESDLKKLNNVKVEISDQDFSYSGQALIKSWEEIDKTPFIPYLNDQDTSNYLIFEAPIEISLKRSNIPIYKNFFGNLINWGGDNKIFVSQIKNTIIYELIFILILIVLRVVFVLAKSHKPEEENSHELLIQRKKYVVIVLSLLSSLVSIAIVCWLIYIIYKPDISSILKESSLDYVGNFFKSFRPKPVERLQFVISTILSPFILWFFYYWFNRKISETNILLKKYYSYIVIISTALILAIIYWGLAMSGFFYIKDSYFYNGIGKFLFSLVLFPIALHLVIKKDLSRTFKIILQLMIIVSLFLVFFMNIINLNNSFSTEDLDPVIYPVDQVMNGNSLLVDSTSLYGLYPFFISPIFKLFGLSILNFSLLMAILIVLSLVFIYLCIKDIVKNKILLLSGYITLVFSTLLATRITPDYYLQYWPIRFLFPSLALLIASTYFKSQTKILYYSSFLIFSIGVLWNFDVGIIVLLSWLIILAFNEIANNTNLRNASLKIAKHVAVTILSLTIIVIYFAINTYISSGHLPNISLFLQYQKIFLSGYLMIKMIFPPHTWNIIVIIYLFGLLISIKALYHKKVEYVDKMIFFLSVLGIGLFSYYEGQSSDVTLFRISYPAIILVIIFADILLGRIKTYGLKIYGEVAIFSILFYFIISGPFNLIYNAGKYNDFFLLGMNNIVLKESVAIENINFIKNNTYTGEKILILTPPDQGSYYIESKTVSALNIASLPDIPFPSEMKMLIDFLKQNTNTKIFVRAPLDKYDTYDAQIKRILTEKYKETKKNTNNISLYEIK